MINLSFVPIPKEPVNLTISQYDNILFDGEAYSVSSFNEKGIFDILYSHTKFITIIEKEIVVVDTKHAKHNFTFERAILHCHTNKILVFLGI